MAVFGKNFVFEQLLTTFDIDQALIICHKNLGKIKFGKKIFFDSLEDFYNKISP